MASLKSFKVTEYTESPSLKHTNVKAKDIDDGIMKYLISKGKSEDTEFVLCSVLQSGKSTNPFKNFTYGHKKHNRTHDYVTDIQFARIEQTK